MKLTIGLGLVVLLLHACPANAAFKKPGRATIEVKNDTGFCIEATIAIEQSKQIQPGGIATFEVEAGAVALDFSVCDSAACLGVVSDSVQVENGECTTLIVTADFDELLGCSLSWREAPCDSTAALTREAIVLTCSSSGLFALAWLGFLLGRAPRRREEQPLQHE